MSTYCSRLQPALQNLLQHVVRFFHPRSSCMTTHISADVQSVTTWIMNSCCNTHGLCMTISGGRTEQLDIFCRVIGFTSDFLSFIVVELIRFFHGAIHLIPAQRVCFCVQNAHHAWHQEAATCLLRAVAFILLLTISLTQVGGNAPNRTAWTLLGA